MTRYIYLGSDLRIGSFRISFDGRYLVLTIYDPAVKRIKTFALRDGIFFIHVLKLEKYLRKIKNTHPYLWQRYLQVRRWLKRWRGIVNIYEELGVDEKSLQLLYTEIIPIIKKRGYGLRLRQIYGKFKPKPQGRLINWGKWLKIIVHRCGRNTSYDEIVKKVFTKLKKAIREGIVKPKSISSSYDARMHKSLWSQICAKPYLGSKMFIYTLKHPEDLIENWFNWFINEVKSFFKHMWKESIEELENEKHVYGSSYIDWFINKLKEAKYKGLIYIYNMSRNVEKGDKMYPVHIYYYEPSDVDDLHYAIYVEVCRYVKPVVAFSEVIAIYDNGRVKLHYIEPSLIRDKEGRLDILYTAVNIVGNRKLRPKLAGRVTRTQLFTYNLDENNVKGMVKELRKK